MFKLGSQNLFPALVFARLDLDSELDVARFMCRLFGVSTDYYQSLVPASLEPDWARVEGADISIKEIDDEGSDCDVSPAESQAERSELLESIWGMQAPLQRFGQLLWLHLQSADQDGFRNRFVRSPQAFFEDTRGAKDKLERIQRELRRVLRAFERTQLLSREVGQAQAGETFFLPSTEAALFRKHLTRAYPDLLTQASIFQELAGARLRSLTARSGFLQVPSLAEGRMYTGRCFAPERGVWVHDGADQWLLKDASDPWERPDFAWGYHGGGPNELANSLLTDATGGLSAFAGSEEPFRTASRAFVDEVVSKLPCEDDFELSRRDVWHWLLGKGFTAEELMAQQTRAKSRYERVLSEIDRWVTARQTSLVAQRFDLVPPDLECAIYVDLFNYIQNGGRILFCDVCGQAIPDGLSGSGHRRSRTTRGLAVYHPDCFQVRRAKRKRDGAREYARRPEVKAARAKQREQTPK